MYFNPNYLTKEPALIQKAQRFFGIPVMVEVCGGVLRVRPAKHPHRPIPQQNLKSQHISVESYCISIQYGKILIRARLISPIRAALQFVIHCSLLSDDRSGKDMTLFSHKIKSSLQPLLLLTLASFILGAFSACSPAVLSLPDAVQLKTGVREALSGPVLQPQPTALPGPEETPEGNHVSTAEERDEQFLVIEEIVIGLLLIAVIGSACLIQQDWS